MCAFFEHHNYYTFDVPIILKLASHMCYATYTPVFAKNH